MLQRPHILDPNFLDFGSDHEHRIYLDETLLVYAVVDEEDYWYFNQWCWKKGVSKRGKVYARRTGIRRDEGRIIKPSLYLHIEIMKRTGIKPPTVAHTIVDHRNGESLLCHRANLRWATPTMNALNINGSHPHDLVEG